MTGRGLGVQVCATAGSTGATLQLRAPEELIAFLGLWQLATAQAHLFGSPDDDGGSDMAYQTVLAA
jgi:hypothetical protein